VCALLNAKADNFMKKKQETDKTDHLACLTCLCWCQNTTLSNIRSFRATEDHSPEQLRMNTSHPT